MAYVLCARLSQWFMPYREQVGGRAGAAPKILVTFRLLMDVARKKKFKLHVTFVDFSRAYDHMPRKNLFTCLKQMACGVTMLLSLVAMHKYTNNVIGAALIATIIDVRQGSTTSCELFAMYINAYR